MFVKEEVKEKAHANDPHKLVFFQRKLREEFVLLIV